MFTYSGELTGVPNSGRRPSILRSCTPLLPKSKFLKDGVGGMIATKGGQDFGGYGLFLSKGESESAAARLV